MSKIHNVFISWSGTRSRLVAEFLHGWLSKVVQAAKPWMSDTEIDKGSRGLDEITSALSDIKVGVVCLSPENVREPWILFESGALSKTIDDRTRLCTYLICGLESADVRPPLGMFQSTKATKEDTLKLVRTINRKVSDDPIPDEDLDELFEAMWPKLESRLVSLPSPEQTPPEKRTAEDMVGEILELVRSQAGHREKIEFMEEYIPTFQRFMPLLQQLIQNAGRAGAIVAPSRFKLGYPRDTSLERPPNSTSKLINTFGFPKSLQAAMPTNPRISGRRLDLIQMFGQTTNNEEGPYGTIRFTTKGIEEASGLEGTYDIDFTIDVDTARKIAVYLEQIASAAERM